MPKMTKVAEIIREAQESVDLYTFDGSPEQWKKLLKNKLSDPWVPALIREIQEKGFTVPIRYGYQEIGNGHHRLAIAILLGMEEIPTTDNVFESSGWDGRRVLELNEKPEDGIGAKKLANMVETAIDWDNWGKGD